MEVWDEGVVDARQWTHLPTGFSSKKPVASPFNSMSLYQFDLYLGAYEFVSFLEAEGGDAREDEHDDDDVDPSEGGG